MVFLLALSLVAGAGVVGAQEYDKHSPEVPFVPSPNDVVAAMLKLAGVTKTDTVFDLGSGDGRIVIMAVKNFGATKGVGVDINPERISEATENAKKQGVGGKVSFREGDLFDADIHEATVVTLYLLPDVNVRLRPKLFKDLKAGTRVVSHSFDMGNWKPDKEETVDGRRIYLWTIPPKDKQPK